MTEDGDSTEIALLMKPLTELIVKPFKALFFSRKEVLLCVIFRVRQLGSIAPVAVIAVIIYQRVFLSLLMAAMQSVNVILIFAVIALAIQNVRKYGERR